MLGMILSLCALSVQQAEGARVTETRPDGAVLEYEVRESESGEQLRHGEFIYTDAQGTKRLIGAYKDGLRSGRWNFRDEHGKPWVSGSYKQGRRTGKWSLRHPDGELRAKGNYKRGGLDKSWQFRREDESPDERHSGQYVGFEVQLPDDQLESKGQLLDGALHGRCEFHWQTGAPMLRAEFERGDAVGSWEFKHPDGTLDPLFFSEARRAGSWPSELDGELLPLDTSAASVEEAELGDASRATSVAAYAAIIDTSQAPEGVWRVYTNLRAADADQHATLITELVGYGRQGLAPVLAELRELDGEGAQDLARSVQLLDEVVAPILGGHPLLPLGGARDTAAVQLAVLRAHALYLLTAEVEEWWRIDLRVGGHEHTASEAPCSTLMQPPFDAGIGSAGGGASPVYAGRFPKERAKLLRARGGTGTERAVAAGLEWLIEHQAEDGHWEAADSFHDVGVTGLALLSLVADGHTTRQGRYRESVLRGLIWLLGQQKSNGRFQRVALKPDPKTGKPVKMISHVDIYNHAIATQAICELASFSQSAIIRQSAQRAIDRIHSSRNPYGAWRYEDPAVGDNDTSITGWMVSALLAGERAGITGSDRAPAHWAGWREGATSWMQVATFLETGRCGYTSIGTQSSRIPGENDQYPRKAEPLTAIALWTQLRLGKVPEEDFPAQAYADLLLRALPMWKPEERRGDLYAWYHGTYAMLAMEGKHWKSWNSSLKRVALAAQRRDGDEGGSWDPSGPWGYLGGRVYSTAMVTLSLQSYYRYDEPGEGAR